MMTENCVPAWSLRRLTVVDEGQIEGLCDVLIDCVEGGASVSFMSPLTRERAVAFWRNVAEGVSAGERALLIAEDQQGICGSVQLILNLPENQPHRADLAKMLVHRRVRRQGLGAALMQAAEQVAQQSGKRLLVLDAVTHGPAARLYERLGWIRVGDIPNFALMPRGAPCSTTYYYRDLTQPAAAASDVAEHQATIHWTRTSPDFLKGKYSREHTWTFDGGVIVPASPSPHVVPAPYSNPAHVDPEEALVASISSCHMLTYLYLASRQGFLVDSYHDEAVGVMTKNQAGVPWVSLVTLHPKIFFSGEKLPTSDEEQQLHHRAHEQCYIANSIKTEVRIA